MTADTRPLARRRPSAAERSAQVLLLALTLVGLGAVILAVACYTLEPHVIVAALVVALLFLVFQVESRPQHLPEGGFYPSRSTRSR